MEYRSSAMHCSSFSRRLVARCFIIDSNDPSPNTAFSFFFLVLVLVPLVLVVVLLVVPLEMDLDADVVLLWTVPLVAFGVLVAEVAKLSLL